MAAKVRKDEPLQPGTVVVFSNKAWKPIRGTPWEGLEKHRPFSGHLSKLKQGKLQRYHDHSFLMIQPMLAP